MILVAVSRVRNEIDIIEAFVRHHAHHFDRIIILDDGSTDGTYEALTALEAAGLPLLILREASIGSTQSHYMTRLLRMAFEQFAADWVAPLDADEFIEPPAGRRLRHVLPEGSRQPLSVQWNNFVWRPEDDAADETNPVRRLTLRVGPHEPGLAKVLVPTRLASPNAMALVEGNHRVLGPVDEVDSQIT